MSLHLIFQMNELMKNALALSQQCMWWSIELGQLIVFCLLCCVSLVTGSPDFVTFMLCMLLYQIQVSSVIKWPAPTLKSLGFFSFKSDIWSCVLPYLSKTFLSYSDRWVSMDPFNKLMTLALECCISGSFHFCFYLPLHWEGKVLLWFSPLLHLCNTAVTSRGCHCAGL